MSKTYEMKVKTNTMEIDSDDGLKGNYRKILDYQRGIYSSDCPKTETENTVSGHWLSPQSILESIKYNIFDFIKRQQKVPMVNIFNILNSIPDDVYMDAIYNYRIGTKDRTPAITILAQSIAMRIGAVPYDFYSSLVKYLWELN